MTTIEAVSGKDVQKRCYVAIARGIASQSPGFVEHARNAELWDVNGRRYVGFATGVAMVNTGHAHPARAGRGSKGISRLPLRRVLVSPYKVAVELAEHLNRLAPGPTSKNSIFVTSDAKAVENAIEVARAGDGSMLPTSG